MMMHLALLKGHTAVIMAMGCGLALVTCVLVMLAQLRSKIM